MKFKEEQKDIKDIYLIYIQFLLSKNINVFE